MFTQDKTEEFDWTRHSASTRNTKYTPNTGPSSDRTGSKQGMLFKPLHLWLLIWKWLNYKKIWYYIYTVFLSPNKTSKYFTSLLCWDMLILHVTLYYNRMYFITMCILWTSNLWLWYNWHWRVARPVTWYIEHEDEYTCTNIILND